MPAGLEEAGVGWFKNGVQYGAQCKSVIQLLSDALDNEANSNNPSNYQMSTIPLFLAGQSSNK